MSTKQATTGVRKSLPLNWEAGLRAVERVEEASYAADAASRSTEDDAERAGARRRRPDSADEA